MRLRGKTTIPPVDVEALLELIPAFAQAWRDLRFEDGIYVDPDGKRHGRLRVEQGTHPVAGVRYRMAVESESEALAEPTSTTTVDTTLVTDTADRLAVHAEGSGGEEFTVDVEIRRPSHVEGLLFQRTARSGDDWLTGGDLTTEVAIDRDQLPQPGRKSGPIVALMAHRRAAVVLTTTVDSRRDDAWTVNLDIVVRGRGWLRPVLAVAGPFVKGAMRRPLEEILAGAPATVEDANRQIADARRLGPAAFATQRLHDMLLSVLDPELRRG